MVLLLFDIDGTLTQPMQKISDDTKEFLRSCKDSGYTLGVVGGSDEEKARKQLGDDYRELFDHSFHENGCVYYRGCTLEQRDMLEDYLGGGHTDELVSFLLRLLSEVEVPSRSGTFIERRSCMLNVSPVGRACSQSQREEFFQYDNIHHVRRNMVEAICKRFPDLPVEIAVGGMISIDIYPRGLNKTRCLRYLEDEHEIHFFGDRCDPGGNDYDLFISERVTGHRVHGPEDTIRQLRAMLSNSL